MSQWPGQASLITTKTWHTIAKLRRAVFDYIEDWYNPYRLHSSLGYMSPAQWDVTCRKAITEAHNLKNPVR